MRSQLFDEKPVRIQISTDRWVRILPDKGDGYLLYDVLQEAFAGRILMDAADNWIYEGQSLSVHEQEDVAGYITGYQKEMAQLISSI